MSLNISGVAIDANYEQDFATLQNQLKLSLEYQEDTTLETILHNRTDLGIAYVFSSENSTLVFLNAKQCIKPYPIPNQKALSFVLHEETQSFFLHYSNSNKVERILVERGEQKVHEEGKPFDCETMNLTTPEIIVKKLDETLAIPFHSIPSNTSIKKFKITHIQSPSSNSGSVTNVLRKIYIVVFIISVILAVLKMVFL